MVDEEHVSFLRGLNPDKLHGTLAAAASLPPPDVDRAAIIDRALRLTVKRVFRVSADGG